MNRSFSHGLTNDRFRLLPFNYFISNLFHFIFVVEMYRICTNKCKIVGHFVSYTFKLHFSFSLVPFFIFNNLKGAIRLVHKFKDFHRSEMNVWLFWCLKFKGRCWFWMNYKLFRKSLLFLFCLIIILVFANYVWIGQTDTMTLAS